MSRYDVEKFHPPPDPELICCICQCVLDNAKESPCRHVFCKVCIEQWLNDHNSCPTCRTWLSKRDLQNVLPLVQNMINKLVMFCDYRSNGCEQKLVLEIYDAHIQKCDFKLLQCSNVGCYVSLLRKDLSQHVNHVCEFREVTCNKGCQLKIPINDLNFHNCMIALKQKSEKQKKLIEEYLKKIQELVSLKDLLKKKVENLLRNIDRSTPVPGESASNLFSSSSYEEDEDITPINVVPRGGGDNTDARLSVISNYFEFYANAVDRITSEVSQIQNEASIIFNSEFGSASNSNALSLLQDEGRTATNTESRRSGQRRNDDISTLRNSLGGQRQDSLETISRDRYSLSVSSYLDMSLDHEVNARAAPISPGTTTATAGGSTGTDDRFNLTDIELDVSYVADSEDGNNSAADEYTYDNVSDNGIFESDDDDDDEEDEDDDYDDVPSDVSSSIQSSLLANVHSESAADEAEHPNNLRNLYEEESATEIWPDPNNVNQSTEGANTHHSSETVPRESDNVSVNAADGDSYLPLSEENYLSSNYISSPSVTSVQYSPLLYSSPFNDSESEIYEHNVVTYSDLSDDDDDDDEANHDIELVLDTEVTYLSPNAENPSHRTTNNNTHSDSHVLSDDEEDDCRDDNDDANNDDGSNTLYHLAVSDCPSSPADDQDDDNEEEADQNAEGQHIVCVLESSNSAHPIESSTTGNMQNTELNEVSITHICTSNNKPSVNNNNNNNNNNAASVDHLERPPSRTNMYQQRQRYIEMNSEAPVTISGQHNFARFLQTGKESLRFSQHVLFDSTEPDCPVSSVSIKIEPTQDIGRMSSTTEIGDAQKTVLSARASYNSRMTQACLQVNPTGTGDAKSLSERFMQTDNSNRYTSSSQRTLSNMHVSRSPKRPNSLSTEPRPLVKRRRTRDYSNCNSSSQTVPTATLCNRVDLSVINVREPSSQSLPSKRHRCSRYPATVSAPTVSTTSIMTPTITSNSLSTATCTYSPRLMLNSGRQSVPSSGGRTRRSQRRSTREWQVNFIQPDVNDIRVVEERTLSSTAENAVGDNQTFRDRRHSHRSEYSAEQQADSDDDASYEPSDSYSSDDTDGQETDSSYEVLVPKSISQLLEEYDSEETDESWTFDMA